MRSASCTMSTLLMKTISFLQADLLREKNVLTRLRHHAVSRGDHETAPSIWAAPVIMFLM